MEASNGSMFMPLLAVLGWLGLKIFWFPIRVGETDVARNVGLWKLALESPKSTNFGVLPKTELLAKLILSRRLMLATLAETDSTPLTPQKKDVNFSFTAENPLMEASNGLASLTLLGVLGLLGLKIYWFPIRFGETDVAMNIGLWKLALDIILEEEVSLGVARSLKITVIGIIGLGGFTSAFGFYLYRTRKVCIHRLRFPDK